MLWALVLTGGDPRSVSSFRFIALLFFFLKIIQKSDNRGCHLQHKSLLLNIEDNTVPTTLKYIKEYMLFLFDKMLDGH
jgi:hypothetical protein